MGVKVCLFGVSKIGIMKDYLMDDGSHLGRLLGDTGRVINAYCA